MTILVASPASQAQHDAHAAADEHWMGQALDLTRQALGRVSPNPAVGAVIVRDGQVVGRGHTEPPGQRHAEIMALEQAGDQAAGATMYVTLEPCAHHGRTPPCLDAMLEARIARVVIAVHDPNPLVNGKSIATLRERGVDVQLGVGESEAIQLNAGFFRRLQTGRPEVHVKYAMSLDGKIATQTGHARWITGPEARRRSHIIRDRSDAILVGIDTVLADDPLLTTRLNEDDAGAGGPAHPLRVIVDSFGRTPESAAMLRPDTPGRTLIAVTEAAPTERIAQLEQAGAEVLIVEGRDGHVDLGALLDCLGQRGINTLMIEGGARIIGSLADDRLIDQVTAFIAPVLLGGEAAPSPIAGLGIERADHGLRLISPVIEAAGDDLKVSGYVAGRYPDEGLLACSPAS